MGAGGSKKEASGGRFDNIDLNSTRLDLQSKGIANLPNDVANLGLLKQLKWLSLQNNHITVLPETIGQLAVLQTLRLRGNKIAKLPDTMSQLVNLQNIDASKNLFTTFPTVACMAQVLELNLQYNLIETIAPEISKMANLRQLNLYFNRIKTLGDLDFSTLTALEQLELAHNPLTELSSNVTTLKKLTLFSLAGCELKSLPKQIGGMPALRTLDVRFNKLESVPEEIGELAPTLKILRLRGNSLKQLPDSIGKLTAVEELHIAHNDLATLNPAVGKLAGLNFLHVYYNQLTSLPAEISDLALMKELDVSYNKLATFPKVMKCYNLQTLMAMNNQVTEIAPETFECLTALQHLALSYNKITTVPPTVTALKSLNRFELNYNRVDDLPDMTGMAQLNWVELCCNRLNKVPETLSKLNLCILNLAGNYLTELPASFASLTALQKLNVSYNRIRALPPEAENWKVLHELHLDGNRLDAFPAVVCKLYSVKDFSACNCNITSLPPEISKLTTLSVLRLSVNKLVSLPNEFFELPSLSEVDLSHNRLPNFHEGFAHLTKLTDIDISGNAIESIPDQVSAQLKDLIQLKIGFNRLRCLPVYPVEVKKKPWISFAGNEILSILYDKEIEEEKFLLKLDKVERKRTKKNPKLKSSGNDSEDGYSDSDKRSRKPSDAPPRLEGLKEEDSEEMPRARNNVGTPTDDSVMQAQMGKKSSKDSPLDSSVISPNTASLPPPLEDATGSTSTPIPIPGKITAGGADSDASLSSSSVDLRSSSSIPKEFGSDRKKTPKASRKKDGDGMKRSGDDIAKVRATIDDPTVTTISVGSDWSPSKSEDVVIATGGDDASPRAVKENKKPNKRSNLKKTNSGLAAQILPQGITHSDDRRKTIGGATDADHLKNFRNSPAGLSTVSLAPVEDPNDHESWEPKKDLKVYEAELKEKKTILKQHLAKLKAGPHSDDEVKKVEGQWEALKKELKDLEQQQKFEKKNTHVLELSLSQTSTELTVAADASQSATKDGIKKRKSSFITKEKIEIRPFNPEDVFVRYRKIMGWGEMRGRRPDQQDTLVLIDSFMGVHDLYFLGLFDGHAGSASAEWSARRLPLAVANALRTAVFGANVSDKQTKTITPAMIAQISKEQSDKMLYNSFADVHEEIASAKLTDGTAAMAALIYQPRNGEVLTPITGLEVSSPAASVVSSPASPKPAGSEKDPRRQSAASDKDEVRKSKSSLGASSSSILNDQGTASPPKPKKKSAVSKAANEPSGNVRARLMLANAGDQRAVLCRNGKAVQVTTDHKPDLPSELARIKLTGGFVAEDRRVLGVLALSRALGDVDLNPHVTFLPDLFFMDIYDESDEFLIIACDGVWDVLTNEQAVALVMAENGDPVKGAAKLRDIAFALNSTDNISVVVYQFKEAATRVARAKSFGAASPLAPLKK